MFIYLDLDSWRTEGDDIVAKKPRDVSINRVYILILFRGKIRVTRTYSGHRAKLTLSIKFINKICYTLVFMSMLCIYVSYIYFNCVPFLKVIFFFATFSHLIYSKSYVFDVGVRICL